MNALILARAQFAANMSFHILFPTISIALGWMLLFMRARWLATKDCAWLEAYRFWTKVFALTFALGVVSGVTMSFQFGTNWPGYMERIGEVAGPLLGYEVLTAFFLEATFLGVMLFGHGRVGERMHLAATLLVALGTTFSAFWILCLDSWMQTPAGTEMVDGVVRVTSWLAVLGNPSFPYRFAHMLIASGLTVSFLLAGVGAGQALKGKATPATSRSFRLGLTLAAFLAPIQILVGDAHGLNTLEHQPAKIAAMEGVWHTERGAPLLLFAWPDEQARRNDHVIGIPRGASLVLRHDPDGEVKGLDEFPLAHPPVRPLFFGFRVMAGVGVLMLASAWFGVWASRRARWQTHRLPRPLLHLLRAMTFAGWLATLAGWYVTEIGRQPWIAYGLVRTSEVASTVPPSHIGATLAMYVVLYVALIASYIAALRHMAGAREGALAPQGGKAIADVVEAISGTFSDKGFLR
jgi:cytochrome d ubiquinol oxidase subunit I